MDKVLKIDHNLSEIFKYFKDHSDRYFNTECCGFLGFKEDQFIAQMAENRSPEPQSFFCVDPVDYLKFCHDYTMIAIFHSHINTNAVFSESDKFASEAICLPYLMYSVQENKFSLYIPENHEIDVSILEKVQGLL